MFELLSTKQFQILNFGPKKSAELKVQRMLRKIKSKLPIQDYKCLYPTGSYPGRFYGTAKLQKFNLMGMLTTVPLDQQSQISIQQLIHFRNT